MYRKNEISSIYKAQSLLKTNSTGKYYKKLFCLSLLDRKTYKEVSELCGVSVLSLRNWLKKLSTLGEDSLKSKVINPRKPKVLEEHKIFLKKQLDTNPNITLNHLQKQLYDNFSLKVSLNTIWKHLKLLNYSYITGRKKHYKNNDSQEE